MDLGNCIVEVEARGGAKRRGQGDFNRQISASGSCRVPKVTEAMRKYVQQTTNTFVREQNRQARTIIRHHLKCRVGKHSITLHARYRYIATSIHAPGTGLGEEAVDVLSGPVAGPGSVLEDCVPKSEILGMDSSDRAAAW